MHHIAITPALLDAIHKGLASPSRAITTQEISGDEACLVCGDLRHELVGMSTRRLKISELTKKDFWAAGIRGTLDDVVTFLEATGQPASLETEVALVEWTKLKPASLPIASVRTSRHPIESEDTKDDAPHLLLEKMIVPFEQAHDGDVVAISLPYTYEPLSAFDEEATEKDFIVLIREGQGLAAKPARDCSDELAARYQAWANHCLQVNGWNNVVSKEAGHQLATYVGPRFSATLFTFTDCAVAVCTSGDKILAVSLPGTNSKSDDNADAELPAHIAARLEGWNIWPACPGQE